MQFVAAVSSRYRIAFAVAVFKLEEARLPRGNDSKGPPLSNRFLEKDKLRSTTVRFSKQDIQIIDALRQRLGLGMVQVIRVAIRRLAQLENIQVSTMKSRDK
jgi:hypothetical protein